MNRKDSRVFASMCGANLLSAIGGSAVLTKGLLLETQFPHTFGDSILAYLIGALIAFFAIISLSKVSRRVTPFLTLAACLCVLFLGLTLNNYEQFPWYQKALFQLLCLHFALVFVPRSFRLEMAAGHSQRLSWVELSYGGGYFIGLLAWQRITQVTLSQVFLITSGVCCLTTLLDWYSFRSALVQKGNKPTQQHPLLSNPNENRALLFRSGLLLVLLTIAIQIGTQILSKIHGNTDPLAAFDLGVTLAPIVCGSLGLSLTNLLGGRIQFKHSSQPGYSIRWIVGICFCAMVSAILISSLKVPATAVFFILIAVAAYLFETIALVILDWVGTLSVPKYTISIIFGTMALGASMTYWAFISYKPGSTSLLLGTMLCLPIALLALRPKLTPSA